MKPSLVLNIPNSILDTLLVLSSGGKLSVAELFGSNSNKIRNLKTNYEPFVVSFWILFTDFIGHGFRHAVEFGVMFIEKGCNRDL